MDESKPDGRSRLFDELVERLDDGEWTSWSDTEFEERAAVAFRHQFAACAPYRALCERRGVTPANVASWHDVPAVPATAFKHFDLVSPEAGEMESSSSDVGASRQGSRGAHPSTGAVFRTSGTTRGAGARGRHLVPRIDLYRASLAEPFRRALLPELGPTSSGAPEGRREAFFVSLIPSPREAPESSLSFMVGAGAERFASDVAWLVDGSGAWRADALGGLRERMAAAARCGAPVLVLGTALSFLHLLGDRRGAVGGGEVQGNAAPMPPATDAGLEAIRASLRDLPETTRVMETGGFKGARRDVSRDDLYDGVEAFTGVPRHRIVNEYGMTELLSQLYEPVLTEGAAASGLHLPPPWLRVRALDPATLEPVPEGAAGILAFFDLANLGSVCHLLTEDVGSVEDGRVRLRGRAAGAEPRGCSRAMDELMSAARG